MIEANYKPARARSTLTTSVVSREDDDLPPFAVLTNDEDRERKARCHRPGTFGVVVTPDSFSHLSEYAAPTSPGTTESRKGSRQGSCSNSRSRFHRSPTPFDPDIVVLDRFEDVLSTVANPYLSASAAISLDSPDVKKQSVSASPPAAYRVLTASPTVETDNEDERILSHFRSYIVRRLVQPLEPDSPPEIHMSGSTCDIFEAEATRFIPLHHAVCAISALNLAYRGRSSLEDAMQYYHHAVSGSMMPMTSVDLLYDGVFLRHYLLFIYDICVPVSTEDGDDNMWALNLRHLRQIATHRHMTRGSEPYAYIVWSIFQLDVSACLLGYGSCEFVQTVLERNMLPPAEDCIPTSGYSSISRYEPGEELVFPAILRLFQGVILCTAKIAQAAQSFRAEAATRLPASPGTNGRWQASSSQLQNELLAFWSQHYPTFLGPDSPQAGHHLPPRVRQVFEHTFALFHAAVIYARTSMFPGQRLFPFATQSRTHADTARRCTSILTLASDILKQPRGGGAAAHRPVVFPLFVAGFAAVQAAAQTQALALLRAFEADGGIGQNTHRTRLLLEAVREEQTRIVRMGGRMEQVEWLALARERGLSVVNCGL